MFVSKASPHFIDVIDRNRLRVEADIRILAGKAVANVVVGQELGEMSLQRRIVSRDLAGERMGTPRSAKINESEIAGTVHGLQ